MNIIQVFKKFPDQRSCIEHLESVRWANGVICPYCGSKNNYPRTSDLRHHCNDCQKSFSVTIGTLFHDTRIPLQKWFLAISLILNAKKGISSRQLSRDLEVNKDTAWRMAMKIRESMKSDGELLTGVVEMDECYIGGKPRKSAKKDDDDKPNSPRGRGTKKTPVVGMVERGGSVKAEKVEKRMLKSKDLNQLIRKSINPIGSVLVTDEYRGYSKVSKILNVYHKRQSDKLSKKTDSRSSRTCSNHNKVLEDLEGLKNFLESLPKNLSIDKKAVSASLHILPSDLEGLPAELLKELNISESDKQEMEILKSIDNAGGVLTIDKLMIQLYRDTGTIHSRKQLAAKLYRMTSKGLLRSNPDKRGAYEILADSQQVESSEETRRNGRKKLEWI